MGFGIGVIAFKVSFGVLGFCTEKATTTEPLERVLKP